MLAMLLMPRDIVRHACNLCFLATLVAFFFVFLLFASLFSYEFSICMGFPLSSLDVPKHSMESLYQSICRA